jgi:GntR family transcriptional regulator/MocR family aminotransferase
LAALLLDRGDHVWLEDPGYPGARAAFTYAGASIVAVPVDAEGIRVDLGIQHAAGARLAFVTPSHQYPSGVVLSLERRIALLGWATQHDAWVIEDDHDGELRYSGQPLTALYSLDSGARVVYVGTFNKSMFVSLRLAYAVVPKALVERLANIRTQLDGFTPVLSQKTLSLFIDEGQFSSHFCHMRTAYGAKRAMLVQGLSSLADQGWTWPDTPAGLQLLARHSRRDYVRRIAAARSVELALLSSYRSLRATDEGLFLRFGALDHTALCMGIETLISLARSRWKQ